MNEEKEINQATEEILKSIKQELIINNKYSNEIRDLMIEQYKEDLQMKNLLIDQYNFQLQIRNDISFLTGLIKFRIYFNIGIIIVTIIGIFLLWKYLGISLDYLL